MSSETIRAKLIPFLADATDLSEETIRSDAHLLEDLEMDSLSALELTVFTEDEFDVSVEEEFKEAIGSPDMRNGMTVGWLVQLIATKELENGS